MPSKTFAQHALMAMSVHARGKMRGKPVPMKVAKEFLAADKGKHFKRKRAS